jgi:glycosyltransferase involved in cell wall biosynthesis
MTAPPDNPNPAETDRRPSCLEGTGPDACRTAIRHDGAAARVLVVAPQPFYENRGTPIAILYVLRALSELGYQIDMLTLPVGDHVEIPGLRILRTRNPLGIRAVPVGFSVGKLVFDGLLYRDLRRELARTTYACVHAVEEAAFYATFLSHRKGVPVIYDMQSSLPEQLAQRPGIGGGIVQRALRWMERRLLYAADYVVCSAGLADYVHATAPGVALREWHFPAAPPAAASGEVAALRAEMNLPADARVIVYSGNFAAYQGTELLFEAAPAILAAVPDAYLVFVGASREAELDRRPGGGAYAERVRVLSRQPRNRMAAFTELASILVSPRNHGGNFPLKIFDYLAAGKPIVATDVPAHRAVLNDSLALLVRPSADAMAEGLIRVLRDRALADRLAAAAGAYARQHLAWSNFVDSVGEIYDRAQAHHGARTAARLRRHDLAGC